MSITFEVSKCFDAEVYADEIDEELNTTEEDSLRLNIGKVFLQSLFYRWTMHYNGEATFIPSTASQDSLQQLPRTSTELSLESIAKNGLYSFNHDSIYPCLDDSSLFEMNQVILVELYEQPSQCIVNMCTFKHTLKEMNVLSVEHLDWCPEWIYMCVIKVNHTRPKTASNSLGSYSIQGTRQIGISITSRS